MKKTISVFLTMLLIFCSFSFLLPVYAAAPEDTLDLSQYSLEDIAAMSAEEYRALLRDFERVYDPFDTYETDPIMAEEEQEPQIAPRWASGDIKNGEYVEQGSHEMITAQALNVLANDKGIFSTNPVEVLAICLSISLASLMPDKDEVGAIWFAGHFYHAIDGDNYVGSSSNTALTNCRDHFDYAVHFAKTGNLEAMCNEIGRALHYLQDAGEPHHAANITAANISHDRFETFVDKDIDSYVNLISSVNGYRFSTSINPTYASSASHTVDFLVQQAASIAYTFRGQVNNALNQTYWDYVASKTIPNSVGFSALLLYKLAYNSGITLY